MKTLRKLDIRMLLANVLVALMQGAPANESKQLLRYWR